MKSLRSFWDSKNKGKHITIALKKRVNYKESNKEKKTYTKNEAEIDGFTRSNREKSNLIDRIERHDF